MLEATMGNSSSLNLEIVVHGASTLTRLRSYSTLVDKATSNLTAATVQFSTSFAIDVIGWYLSSSA